MARKKKTVEPLVVQADRNIDPIEAVENVETELGRPPGAENRAYDTVDKTVTRCKKCGSTDRSEYKKRHEDKLNITLNSPVDGHPYNVIIYQRCKCLACGQWRKDRSYELRDQSKTGI